MRGARRVVRDQHYIVVTNLIDELSSPQFSILFEAIVGLAFVLWSLFHDLAKEGCVAVKYFLCCEPMILLWIVRSGSVALGLQELVCLEQHEVNLLQDPEVQIYEVLLAGLSFRERHKIAKCQLAAQACVYLFEVLRLRISR